MALEISYYGGGAAARPIEGSLLDLSETRTLSAISQKSAGTPPAAVLVSVLATEPARVAYGEDGRRRVRNEPFHGPGRTDHTGCAARLQDCGEDAVNADILSFVLVSFILGGGAFLLKYDR